MTAALRYIITGAICASISMLWQPEWYVALIAFWLGTMLGVGATLGSEAFARWINTGEEQ